MATGQKGPLGTFTSSIVPLGSVLTDSWVANVDANVNGWVNGTGYPLGAQSTGTSSTTPTFQAQDSAGNVRTVIDHNGQIMGRNVVIQENWIYDIGTVTTTATHVAAMPSWGTTCNTGTVSISDPTSAYPSSFASVSVPNTTGATATLASAKPIIHTGASFLSAVIEWEAAMSFVGNNTVIMGLIPTQDAGAATANALYFGRSNSLSTWFCVAQAASVSTTVQLSSVVAASVPNTRFRIELHGSASPYGAATARFFINETLTTITTNIPSAAFYLAFGNVNNTTTGASSLLVGPVRMTYNRMLAPPAL